MCHYSMEIERRLFIGVSCRKLPLFRSRSSFRSNRELLITLLEVVRRSSQRFQLSEMVPRGSLGRNKVVHWGQIKRRNRRNDETEAGWLDRYSTVDKGVIYRRGECGNGLDAADIGDGRRCCWNDL